VPADWQHPKDEQGRFKPLFDGADFGRKVKAWNEAAAAWAKGLRDDFKGGLIPFDGTEPAGAYEQWDGERPDPADYMPQWDSSQATHLMMYECTTGGTPISPAFASAEELARWLSETRANAFAHESADYEHWLALILQGPAVSAVVVDGKLIDPQDKLAAAIREQVRRERRPGTGVTVRYSRINAVDGGDGAVVQIIRSNKTGELLASETLSLADVEANGLPLPDMLKLRSPSA
jgi:hypothetical protein